MAPKIVAASNQSRSSQYLITTDGRTFNILRGPLKTVNASLSDTIDTKIEVNPDDIGRYLLKYDNNYNIMINDTLGRNNGIADTRIRTYYDEEEVNIDVFPDTIKIWCTANDLRVYKPDGELSDYYSSVIASHNEGGGITVTGDGTVAGEPKDHNSNVQNKDNEEEGGSSKD